METRLTKLKSDFANIITVRNNIKSIFDTLSLRIDRLKEFYADFIKTNNQTIFIFGLDSLHFQSKLIDIEYADMQRLFLAISNRMYCEYYKLYKIVVEYITKNVKDSKLIETTKLNQFPLYKDLEPYREYPFETVQEIHAQILTLIGAIITVLTHKEHELSVYQSKQRIGLNIDNFITSYNFNVVVMREEVNTFLTYVEFFHTLHTKYLKRFSNKIQLMYMHVNMDIRFDDTMGLEQSLDMAGQDEVLLDIKQTITSASKSVSSQDSNLHANRSSSSSSPEAKVYSNAELKSLFLDINMSCDNILNSGSEIGFDLDSGMDDVMSVSSSGAKRVSCTTAEIDAVRESHPIQIISDKKPSSNTTVEQVVDDSDGAAVTSTNSGITLEVNGEEQVVIYMEQEGEAQIEDQVVSTEEVLVEPTEEVPDVLDQVVSTEEVLVEPTEEVPDVLDQVVSMEEVLVEPAEEVQVETLVLEQVVSTEEVLVEPIGEVPDVLDQVVSMEEVQVEPIGEVPVEIILDQVVSTEEILVDTPVLEPVVEILVETLATEPTEEAPVETLDLEQVVSTEEVDEALVEQTAEEVLIDTLVTEPAEEAPVESHIEHSENTEEALSLQQ
jgi:hypothetical protein